MKMKDVPEPRATAATLLSAGSRGNNLHDLWCVVTWTGNLFDHVSGRVLRSVVAMLHAYKGSETKAGLEQTEQEGHAIRPLRVSTKQCRATHASLVGPGSKHCLAWLVIP